MSFRPTDRLRDANDALARLLQEPDIDDRILQAVNMFADALREKIPVISCGNGGSMCDAMHFAEELSGRYRKDRPPLPAMAVSDPSYLTCTANDYGYEESFSRWVQAFGRNGGVLLAISTSGNSGNVLRASLCAKELGMKIVALCGRDGGKLAGLADVCLIAPGETTDRIQELHIKLIHIMIEGIERLLFPENYC